MAEDRRQWLRKQAMTARKSLTSAERAAAHNGVLVLLQTILQRYRPNRLGSYRAIGSELDPAAALVGAAPGMRLYLPRIVATNTPLCFVAIDASTRYVCNQHGIEEPESGATIDATELDLMLIPLLAFDRQGVRLGYGGGYYDRTLAQCSSTTPLRVGLAFACQERNDLNRADWDQNLHWIVTERELIECHKY